jgi:hypothetical protein
MKTIILSVSFGLIGGIAGSYFMMRLTPNSAPVSTVSKSSTSVSAENFMLVDKSGKLRAQLAMSREGSPALFLMDTNGAARVVLGIYPPAENELPFLVLNDAKGSAAGIFRLVGANEFPYLVLKHGGSDRAILGLTSAPQESAFFLNIKPGERQVVFGKE